ncbi:hypothetical protein RclHR1_03610004 [Rhizophagus clarus]|uniref:G-protein coupled receptors family 1 profile domain-containing protein n=1 Tax=Rhizophagus clarus TaxID=94130 RepID=A0A2Z6S6F3_9GLOM|nr:hypothetical protein RclHR1_03610004 [Rhizophagus clarus]GES93963.1 hypothetical protein GLOIN_2v1498814 [Rhizophagus clarus]
MNNDTIANATAAPIAATYCDWRIEIYHCVLSELWMAQVTVAVITYLSLAISGTFIFCYRYKHMWKGLFVDHGHGIRPLPVDNLLFFWTIACYLRGLHSLLMVTNAYTRFWQMEFMQEIGWTMLCYGGILYLIGIIYTIPVNYTRGKATLKIETKKDSLSYFTSREIYIPTPNTLNVILGLWCLYPTVTALPFAVLSGLSKDHGNYVAASRWTAAQYISYIIFDSSFALIGAYYGIHFMLILRNSMKQFSRRSGGYYQSHSNATRSALDRLKYTMTYIAVLPMISAPWWGIFGIFHDTILDSINGVNIFLATMWHIGGAQPLIAVTQYILAKRVYQHFTGQVSASDDYNSSTSSASDTRKSALSPVTPTFPVTMSSAIIKQNQQDRRISDSYDLESLNGKFEGINLSLKEDGIPDWDNLEIPNNDSRNSNNERNVV